MGAAWSRQAMCVTRPLVVGLRPGAWMSVSCECRGFIGTTTRFPVQDNPPGACMYVPEYDHA